MKQTGKSILLDTSIVVRHFREPGVLENRLAIFEELFLPQIALGELYAGAYRSSNAVENLKKIERFLDAVDILLPDQTTAQVYGRISAQLRIAGTPIPQNDIWIAALAMQANLPLATADLHFNNVKGIEVCAI